MSLLEYYEGLSFIHRLITERFRKHIHTIQPSATTQTSAEEKLISMLRILNKDLVIWSNCLIQNHSVDVLLLDYQIAIEVNGGIHDATFKMSQDAFKADYLHEHFKIHVMTAENNDIVRVANEVTAQIRSRSLKKGDRKRIKKLHQDILIKTIAYWIDEKDIARLLLTSKSNNPIPLSIFKSKILQPLKTFTTEAQATDVAA